MLRHVGFALAALICTNASLVSAQQPAELTVYTYDSFATEWGPGPALKAGFEQSCGCTVTFESSEDAISTLRKLQLEGAASPADVILGLDTATYGEARRTGLIAPHGLDLPELAIAWDDADFVPFDYGYFAYVYNTETVPNPPTSFEELIALPDSFKVVIQDPRSSTPGLGHVLWVQLAYGERAPEIWAGLRPHILTITRGWSDAYSLFLAGEADMVLSYTTSPAYHAIAEEDDRFAFAEFSEGYVPQVEVAGVTASSDQPELAREFLAFLVSEEAQRIIPTTNWMYPVRDIGDALPAAFGTPPQNIIAVDEQVVHENAGAWVDAALAALR